MTKEDTIKRRLEALREVMQRERLGAFIFPSTDPHQSEYVADHWKGREWISGFNGSAGTAVVTMDGAALWTDSRYFLAAEEQLKGTEFQLMKLKVEGTPTIAKWISSQLSNHSCPSTEVGIDGWCCSASMVKELVGDLRREGGLTLRTNLDPLAQIWKERPPIPQNLVEIYPLEYAGESCRDKITRIRKALREKHADGMLVAALDDIAWTLNLRGGDIHCNPVFVSYLLISTTAATLYVNPLKLTSEVKAYLRAERVTTDDYSNVRQGLRNYSEYNILLDANEVNEILYKTVTCEKVEAESPVGSMKSVKNTTEVAGVKSAMLRDGIAMVKFLKWLEESDKERLTEMAVDKQLTALRSEQQLFRGISFDTIAGYQEHGAIVHYEATPESDKQLKAEGLLLLDSGAQYVDGTTDITRTIALGPLTEEQRRVYTLVLKAHIQLEMAKFPEGTTGTQIDAIAREPLWREGLNYLHGTGHGVGCYLNVHEGPHQIRMEWRPAPLVSGMTVTDEPGIYLKDRFGVRIENTLLIIPYKETEHGLFLGFEPLTLCPIDLSPVIADMLSDEERQWLNDYHQTVYDRLSPLLDEDERRWLLKATAPLSPVMP
jgi:Xaa-Pro aminopeptidase